jgi:hypothetical protein
MISNTNGMGLFILARNHGHEWTNHTNISQIKDEGWEVASKEANQGVENLQKERRENNVFLPGGITADIGHTTGSGRLSWLARHGESGTINLEVARPGLGLTGSTSVVLRLEAKAFNHPAGLDLVWELDDIEIVTELVHLRHVRAITLALFDKADEAEVEWFLKFVKNPAFAAKIRKELAEEVAAAELAAGVPAQRPTSFGTVRGPAIVD